MVTVYTTPTCGKCKVLIAMCDGAGINVDVVDITKDTSAQAKLLAKGYSTVPVINIEGELHKGEAKELYSKIVQAGIW